MKATPTFNRELCDRFGVKPLHFEGRDDALMHPFDQAGRQHMEYVCDHGIWSDFPFDRVMKDFRDYYPDSFFNPVTRETIHTRFEQEQPLS